MNHHTFFGSNTKPLIFAASLILSLTSFIANSIADDDSLTDRNRVVGRRIGKFFSKDLTRHFIYLSAEYDSDEDSKQQIVKIDHYFKNNILISDVELSLETLYEEQRSKNKKDKKKYLLKERDLYKIISSQKVLLPIKSLYGVFFNETRHDDESDISYRDIVTATGVGKSFFNRNLEIDISCGLATGKNITDTTYQSARKNYKRSVIIYSMRSELKLSKKFRLINRGYMYDSGNIKSYYLNSRLQYKISKNFYLQISHLFDKREFELYNKRNNYHMRSVNEIRRQTLLGIRYDFGK